MGTSSSAGGALSSMLNLGTSGSSNDYVRYQKILTSPAVATRLQKKYHMLQYIFAGAWDKKSQHWIQPNSLRSYIWGWLFKISHVPVWTPPDVSTLSDYLTANINILPSTQSDIVILSMDNADPQLAERVLFLANLEANEVLRDQAAIRSKQKVEYLRNKLNQVSIEDYRQALLALLSAEEKTLMVTETSDAYAAEIISPPMTSATPVSPRPITTLFVAILIGIIAGSTIVIFWGPNWWKAVLMRLPSFGGHNRYAGTLRRHPAE